jgi:hypothetical protein
MFVCVCIYIYIYRLKSINRTFLFFVFRGNSDCLMHFKILLRKKMLRFSGKKIF